MEPKTLSPVGPLVATRAQSSRFVMKKVWILAAASYKSRGTENVYTVAEIAGSLNGSQMGSKGSVSRELVRNWVEDMPRHKLCLCRGFGCESP